MAADGKHRFRNFYIREKQQMFLVIKKQTVHHSQMDSPQTCLDEL